MKDNMGSINFEFILEWIWRTKVWIEENYFIIHLVLPIVILQL
jgi:hypothetical protein